MQLVVVVLIVLCPVSLLSSQEYLGESSKHLFYFVHVTDIHVSHFGHEDRISEFERFCNEIIKSLIKPRVTVVTGGIDSVFEIERRTFFLPGDLTHNRDQTFASQQYEEEWKIYRDLLRRTNVTEATLWLDMRGNHGESLSINRGKTTERSVFRCVHGC